MITAAKTKITNGRPGRRLLVTLAASIPLIFLVVVLFSGWIWRKEKPHV